MSKVMTIGKEEVLAIFKDEKKKRWVLVLNDKDPVYPFGPEDYFYCTIVIEVNKVEENKVKNIYYGVASYDPEVENDHLGIEVGKLPFPLVKEVESFSLFGFTV